MNKLLISTSRFLVWIIAVLVTQMAVANPNSVESTDQTPTITVSPSSLTILNYSEYEGQFPATYTVSATGLTSNLTITAPPYFLVSALGNTGPSLSIPAPNGTVSPTQISVILLSSSPGSFTGVVTNSSGSAVTTVAVSGTALGQSVSVSPAALNPFTTTVGQPSAIQSYTVTNRGGLMVSVSAPAGFEIRTGNNPFGSSLVINPSLYFTNTQIDVRLTGAVAGSVSGVISQDTYYHAAHGVYPVAVSGEVTPGAPALSVSYRDADYGNKTDQIIRPYLQINNEGNTSIPYGQLTVRYWFTSEGSSLPTNFQTYYAQLGTSKVKMKYVALSEPRQGALGYVEYSFDPSAGSLAGMAKSGPIESGIQKQDRSAFNEADDYSYAASTSYTKNNHITAYLNGVLIWGQEPATLPAVQAVKAYTMARNSDKTTSISTSIELRNEGNVAVPLQALTVRYWFTSETSQPLSIYVDWAQLGAQNIQRKVVRLAQPVAGADSYAELSFAPGLGSLSPLSSTGEILFRLVKPDFTLLDQTNDYSHGPTHLVENPHVGVYLNGSLIYGTEPTGAMGRLGAGEEISAFKVLLFGNPVVNQDAVVETRGAGGLSLHYELVNSQGQPVMTHQVDEAREVEQQRLSMGQQPAGLYFLRVSTPQQKVVVKVVKP